jgi:hypothetical protein
MKAQKTEAKKEKPAIKGALVILSESWWIYKERFHDLLGYSAWILLPYLGIATMYFLLSVDQLISWTFLPIYIVLILAQILVALWATNALMLFINQILDGEKEPDNEKINQSAWQLIMPLVIVGLLHTLVILGGFLLLIIPGIIFSVWYLFAQISVVLDNKRGMAALSFSRSLVKGRFWQILHRSAIGPMIMIAVYLLGISIIFGIGYLLGAEAPTDEMVMIPAWMDVVENIADVLFLPMFLVYWTILYRNVKKTKV